MFLFANYLSLVKYMLKYFAYFKNWAVCFLFFLTSSVLHMVYTRPLSDRQFSVNKLHSLSFYFLDSVFNGAKNIHYCTPGHSCIFLQKNSARILIEIILNQ